LQLYSKQSDFPNLFGNFLKACSRGDIIGAKGKLFVTKAGELTLRVRDLKVLAKSFSPWPDKYHGLIEVSQRYRKRFVDLQVNNETGKIFIFRSKFISFLREFLSRHFFLEVETSYLENNPGGASARPFVTQHHALGKRLVLRIAQELSLKKLVIGGMNRIFELGKVFRNEGLSSRHSPEFTMLEAYAAYEDM